MGATHDSNITLNIILDAAGRSRAGFGVPLLVAEVTMGERVATFASPSDVDDALEANDITSAVADLLTAGLAQQPRPSEIKLGRKDSEENYTDALTAIVSEDDVWYGATIDSRDSADIIAVSDWLETREKLFIAQSADADWLTSGVPTDFDDITVNERTIIAFHDTATEGLDFGWTSNRLTFNPDTRSAPWDTRVYGIAPYASSISSGQRSFALQNNVNLMLPYGPVETFVDPGVTIMGRPIYELITRDWFRFRLEDKIARAKINASARGEKIPLGREGVSVLRPLVESQFSEGVAAGHFVAGQTNIEFIDPTQADIDAQRIRATGSAQLAVSAREFDLSFNFQRTAVNEEDAA